MCDTCGCNRQEPFHIHTGDSSGHGRHFHAHRHEDGSIHIHTHDHEDDAHSHAHHHHHHHDHDHGDSVEGWTVELRQSVLGANDRLAEQNRGYFRALKVRAINILSSPGSGKTTLLERTLADLSSEIPMAVIVGDLATENDAERLRLHCQKVVQITTGTLCHLDAGMVAAAAEAIDPAGIDLLFIENVGNLVCPSAFDLGEEARVILFSVTEGEDKPLKYPPIFKSADLILITKIDLAEATGFNRAAALENIGRIAPRARIMEISARTGAGITEWYSFLREKTGKAAIETSR